MVTKQTVKPKLRNGRTIITVTTADGAKTATTTITVTPVTVTSIAISPDRVRIEIGGTQQLTTIIPPVDADNKDVTWSSSNDKVATVSANGLLTGV